MTHCGCAASHSRVLYLEAKFPEHPSDQLQEARQDLKKQEGQHDDQEQER